MTHFINIMLYFLIIFTFLSRSVLFDVANITMLGFIVCTFLTLVLVYDLPTLRSSIYIGSVNLLIISPKCWQCKTFYYIEIKVLYNFTPTPLCLISCILLHNMASHKIEPCRIFQLCTFTDLGKYASCKYFA